MANTQTHTEVNTETAQETTLTVVETEQNTAAFAVTEATGAQEIRATTTTEQTYLFNALAGGSEKVADYIGKTVDIVAMVVTSADVSKDINDPDGEKECRPCTHFFTDEGKHIASVSNGIAKTARTLLTVGIIPTEETPLRISFKEIPTKKGKAHVFELSK